LIQIQEKKIKKKNGRSIKRIKWTIRKWKRKCKKSGSERDALLLQIEKLKADLDNNTKRNDTIKSDLSILQNKQVELETNLDAVTREKKRQTEQERSNITEELNKVNSDVQAKQQEIDDLHKNLGESNSGTKELTDKIKELSEQRVKLESRGKQLEEEQKDKKNTIW